MKKLLLFVAMMLCCAMTMFAQNDKISYQAVVRDTANRLVANKSVLVTVHIYNGNETTAAYTEMQTVTTNLNGLISLQIGPDGTNAGWNSIQWNKARIETTVKLNGTQLGTLAMPLTAVPYALYAKEISPDAVMITNIYNKMSADSTAIANKLRADSTALADKMHADSLLLHGALNDSTANVRGALKDSVTNVNTRMQTMADNLHNEITTLDNRVTTRMNSISDSVKTTLDSVTTVSTNLHNEISTVSTNLHNEITTLDNKVTTRMNTISDSVKTTLDSVTTVSTNLHNEITAVSTDMQTNYAKLAGANTFTGNNTFSGNNTYSGNNTFTGTVTAGTVTASSVTVTCGNSNLDICTMYNELTQLIAGMQNTIDSLKDVITELLPSLSLKGTKDTVFTNGNTVDVTYTANFSNANSSDYTFQWKVDGTSVNYASNPYTHTYTTIGTHKVVCTATRTGYATLTDSITTTISKGTPVVTAPTAANNLTYNTNAQTLVNAGTTTGGTLYYNVTTTNSKPAADASGWSTDLPTGINAGTYYVWYKVVGGDYYNNKDVSDNSVAVTIAKAAGSISYTTTSVTKNAGEAAFTNTLTNSGDGTVTYSISNNGSNCSIISSTGQVTVGNSAGTATITATVTDGTNYSYATTTATYTLTVQANPIVVNSTFQYCYDVQRDPAYPKAGVSASISGFGDPYVDEQGHIGFAYNTSPEGPWKVEFVGYYSSNQYDFNQNILTTLTSTYNISTSSVPVFKLYKKIDGTWTVLATGVVCAYSKTTNSADHTALFVSLTSGASGGWGFYLTGQSHSSGISVTFDQDISGGLNDLINP